MTNEKRDLIKKVDTVRLRALLKDLPKHYPDHYTVTQSRGSVDKTYMHRAMSGEVRLPCFGCILAHYLPKIHEGNEQFNFENGMIKLTRILGLQHTGELMDLLSVLETEGEVYAYRAFDARASAYTGDGRDDADTNTTMGVVIETWERYADRIESLQGA